MSEDDYDREDLEHVENMLYANIHYDSGCTDNQFSSANQLATMNNVTDDSENNTKIDENHKRNTKRYWSSNTTPNGQRPSKFVPFFKEKQSDIYKTSKLPTNELDGTVIVASKNETRETATSSSAIIPKQFTPYVSFLPFNDSGSNVVDEKSPVASSSDADSNHQKMLKTNNDLVRKDLNKHINPFSKKAAIEQYKMLYNEVEPIYSESMDKTIENKKRLNPFNPFSRKAKKKKSETIQHKSVRKSREELMQRADATSNVRIIDVDDANKDDDDVIILPTQKPPLICIDSSDEETTVVSVHEHEFTEPTAVSDNRRKVPRCASPSSSIQSADDFIVQNDQRTFGFDTFDTLSDDDLCNVSETVENQLKAKTASIASNKGSAIQNSNENAIFTPPKQMQKDKTKSTAKKSYEVADNSFTAVDVYESESSDMPDSIYTKGASSKRKKVSDSDSSSVESVPLTKRLRKRKKSSGSAKESDNKHSDDSSSDLPEDDNDIDGDDDDKNDVSNENSYLVRGEALGKVKNNKKKSTKTNKNTNEKRSEDDFINKLSDIVRAQDDSDNDELESTQEVSTETVAARDIVETVLQRRTRKSKKNQNTESEPPAQLGNDKTSPWEVTDQIGETDDFNLGKIFNENTLDEIGLNDDNKLEECTTTEPQKTEDIQMDQKKSNTEKQSPSTDASNEKNDIVQEENPNVFDAEIAWNDEMKKFYNESWGGEDFSVRNIRGRMPKGFLNWMISNKDKFPSTNNRRINQMRCHNCQEKGHFTKNCPRPPAKKRCYMCGTEGHIEPECPNKMCLTCGRKTNKYLHHGCGECNRDRNMICYVCQQKGHRQTLCPDRWRRYHLTTTLDQPLIEPQKSSKTPNKRKYCCLCAGTGHYADSCNRYRRTIGPLSVRVFSYKPCLFAQKNQKLSEPKCTILTSNLNGNYSFNYGNDVSATGNTIYGRFRRAVQLTENPNQSAVSENDVEFVKESNVHDTSEPAIEIYDDFDYELDGLEDISASEHFINDANSENSFMSIDDLEQENDEAAATTANKEIKSVSVASEKDVAIKKLDNQFQTLEDLKKKVLSLITSHENESEQAQDVTTSSALDDFIPLTSDEPERYEPAPSPSTVSADSTTNSNKKTDATIHITKQHCKHLVSDKGRQFLCDSELQFNVSVRLEWRQYGNVLTVNGTANNQQNFHDMLKKFFESFEDRTQKASTGQQLPKNRDALIKHIRSQFAILDSPMCNVKEMIDVQDLFYRIRGLEKNQSKANTQKVNRLRKQLNMVLFGRYGLGEGKFHMNALEESVRKLLQMSCSNVTIQIRQKMGEHLDYIFSGNDHKNYEDIIDQYDQLKRDKMLQPMNLDRKLFGLKINVIHPNDGHIASRKNPLTDALHPHSNRTATVTSANYQNQQNKPHSFLDIQLNISSPSTSYHNQNESKYRNNSNGSPPNRARSCFQWK